MLSNNPTAVSSLSKRNDLRALDFVLLENDIDDLMTRIRLGWILIGVEVGFGVLRHGCRSVIYPPS